MVVSGSACGAGLVCDTEATPNPVCVQQVAPGGDCENPHTGAEDDALCLNGVRSS